MARVPQIKKREELPSTQGQIFDEIAASRGRVSGPFSVLLNSPETARRIAHAGVHLRFESSLPRQVKELIVLTTAREMDCQYEWTVHEPSARQAGMRQEAIVAIRDRKAPAGLTPEETVVASYAQELLKSHRVSESTFRAAHKMFSLQQLTDLTATVGYYAMLACVLNAFEVEPEGTPPLLPV